MCRDLSASPVKRRPLVAFQARLAAAAIVPAPASRGEAGPAPASASPPFVIRPLAPRFLLAGLAAVTLVGAGLFWNGQRDQRPESPTAATVKELTSATRQQPSILVVGMTGSDPALSAAILNHDNQSSDALARLDEFSLLKAAPAATTVLPTYRFEHVAQFISSTVLQASSRLVHAPTGCVVWTSSVELPATVMAHNDQIRELARDGAVRVAQPYGLIHADPRAHAIGGGPVQCVVRTYDYWSERSSARHADVRECLQTTVRKDPLYHPGWTLLAMIHLDEYRIGYNPMPGSALDRGPAGQHSAR